MKNVLAFLFGWLIAAAILIPQAHAAYIATPVVSGYSAGKIAGSGLSMMAANEGVIAPAVLNVGGRAVTMSASMRFAANAGEYALAGMRLTPLGIVGTLAAGWLLEQGLHWVTDHWEISYDGYSSSDSVVYPSRKAACESTDGFWSGIPAGHTAEYDHSDDGTGQCYRVLHGSTWEGTVQSIGVQYARALPVGATSRAANDADWAALPDPMPTIAPEVADAPYLPGGVPVGSPVYQPADVAIGEPYTRPDGSTAQSRAKISPASDGQVAVDTYDQPLTDSAGDPVVDPAPQDTPDPTQSECEKSPNTIGCAEFGSAAPETVLTHEIPVSTTVTPIGDAGSCPADVTTSHFGITWSYQPICDFADAIRPLIIGFAWLAFAYIVAGTVRT